MKNQQMSLFPMSDLGPAIMYGFGVIEMVIIVGFVLGIARKFTYGAILLFHTVSTLAPMQMYFNPAEGRLFFAAWPMLAACFALYLLRDHDTLWVLAKPRSVSQA